LADPELPAADVVEALFDVRMNAAKRRQTVDLRAAAGMEEALELARRADVLVENFRPGVMARLGLGPEALLAVNPRLVYVSLSGFGSAGPWAAWGSYGPMIEAASSIEHRTGYADGPPLRLGHTLPDGIGGLVGALAAVRGLRERTSTGRGGWYDISQLEAYVAASGEEVLAADLHGSVRPRSGNQHAGAVLQCAGTDEWVAVGATAEAEIAARVALMTKEAAAAWLQALGFEAAPVLSAAELAVDRHLRARGALTTIDIHDRRVTLPRHPLRP